MMRTEHLSPHLTKWGLSVTLVRVSGEWQDASPFGGGSGKNRTGASEEDVHRTLEGIFGTQSKESRMVLLENT